MTQKRGQGVWLHDELARHTAELVGVDLNAEGVAAASELGFESFVADCQQDVELAALHLAPADVVIAGELIEHLDQPGAFLEAVKRLLKDDGILVITTPNATRLTNVLGSLSNRELVNPDHVSWYSWHVLQTLLDRHGWILRRFAFYATPRSKAPTGLPLTDQLRLRAVDATRLVMRPMFRLRPALADGIIVVASFAASTSDRTGGPEGHDETTERDGLQRIAP
jgi:SAM-dependent methyltransferase